MHQTFYRKYRPKKFEYVYGQEPIVKTLKKSIKNGTISHAYLFTGPRGTGKTTSAKLLAKALNCMNNIDGDACDSCENCSMFNKNSNPDIIEIDAASNNGVDEIREIRNNVNLMPSVSKYKIYIIDEVHMLSIGAFNALLKTLEEPPEYVIFILATTEPQKLPNTVISRCQRYDFKLLPSAAMKACLANIIKNEKINIDDTALDEIVLNSNGGMRDAIGLLEQLSMYCDKKIQIEDVSEISGGISSKELNLLIDDIKECNYQNISKRIRDYDSKGKDLALIFQKITNSFYETLISMKTDRLFNSKLSDTQLYNIIETLNKAFGEIYNSYQKRIVMEIALFKVCDIIDKNKVNDVGKNANVSRETLAEENSNSKIDVSRETSNQERSDINNNVSRETLKQSKNNYKESNNELKNVRINNVLFKANKEILEDDKKKLQNINEYIDEKGYKSIVGINQNAIIVASSPEGCILTLSTNSLVDKIEKNEAQNINFFKEKLNIDKKLIYITNEYWQSIRPEYVEKIKNKNLFYIDEKDFVIETEKTREDKLLSEFNELIEMEEQL